MVKRWVLYVLRWAALAVPGAWLLAQVQAAMPGHSYWAMILSQVTLGGGVFFVDREIFGGKQERHLCGQCEEFQTCDRVVLPEIRSLGVGVECKVFYCEHFKKRR